MQQLQQLAQQELAGWKQQQRERGADNSDEGSFKG
jgi:hypothetical protein